MVLYIDDSVDQLDLYELALGERYQFISASQGETGLQLAMVEQPDVIVVDLDMPGMNGWTVCLRLKGDARTAHIPILILTASSASDTLRGKARDAGAAALIEKPCFVDALRDHLDLVLQRPRA